MSEKISFQEALRQWRDLEKLNWGHYWDPEDEPKWARDLTRIFAGSWREVAYRRIATAFLEEIDNPMDSRKSS